MGITQLGYVGVNVTDIPAWEHLATKILGLEARPRETKSDPLYLRMDDRHHRLALYPAKRDEAVYFGWEVPDSVAFDDTCATLRKAGVKLTKGSAAEKRERCVLDLVKFKDPGDFNNEIYHGPQFDNVPLHPGRGISGFKTGDQGLGHVVLATEKPEKLFEFYRDVLGFKQSDFMEFAGAKIWFMHCNPREHTLAIMNPAFGTGAGQLNHIMLEVNSPDDVGRAYDMCLEQKIPIALTIGKHTNDLMTSFYLITPSGFALEYGTDGMAVDDSTWKVRHYLSPSVWGHNPVDPKGVVGPRGY